MAASKELQAIERKLQQLEQKRIDLLGALAALPDERLIAKPDPNRWTLLQVAQHLMLAEKSVRDQALSGERHAPDRRGLRHRVLYWVVLAILRFGIRVRVPSESMVPDGETTLAEIERAWESSQIQLKQFAEGLDTSSARDPIFRHPVCGPMTPSQALTLALVHFDSHRRKIDLTFTEP